MGWSSLLAALIKPLTWLLAIIGIRKSGKDAARKEQLEENAKRMRRAKEIRDDPDSIDDNYLLHPKDR